MLFCFLYSRANYGHKNEVYNVGVVSRMVKPLCFQRVMRILVLRLVQNEVYNFFNLLELEFNFEGAGV